MCICFFHLSDGSEGSPTFVCSNRDEYFARPTGRGQVLSTSPGHLLYRPFDMESGGAWLGFDQLYQASADGRGGLRLAVVLNLHIWREDEKRHLPDNQASVDITQRQSRGHIVQTFIEDKSVTAEDYARRVYADREQYRPFNLIVADEGSAWYISSSHRQTAPLPLVRGRLYGVSNGYMHSVQSSGVEGYAGSSTWDEDWDKVEAGKRVIIEAMTNGALIKRIHEAMTGYGAIASVQSIETVREELLQPQGVKLIPNNGPLSDVLRELLSVMLDDKPRVSLDTSHRVFDKVLVAK